MRNRKYKFQIEQVGKKGWNPIRLGIVLSILLLCCIGVIVVIKGVNRDKNKTEVENYHTIESSKLPEVEIQWGERNINLMHGYQEQLPLAITGSSITPVSSERTVNILITAHDTEVTGMSYRVRDMETEKLIEDGKIKDWKEEEGLISASISFSGLIEEETEYQMELVLKMKESGELYYNTRIYCQNQENIVRLLEFAEGFSAATFDKAAAEAVLVPYILTGESRNNQDLSHVDLYNKFSALTWDNLSPRIEGEVDMVIHEISPTQMSLTFSYDVVSEDENGEVSRFSVCEFFCIRIRNGNFYILDYSRDMEEIFEGRQSDVASGSIRLGIGTDISRPSASSEGTYLAFVKNHQVWLVDTKESSLQRIFAWEDGAAADFQVQLIGVSEEGDAEFLVYGYIPQGEYEGSCQIQGYHYDAAEDRLEMLFYIPVERSRALLEEQLGDVAYVNEDRMCYLLLEHMLYEVNLADGSVTVVSENLQKGSYCVNERGNLIAWEEGEDENMPSYIRELNMGTGKVRTITAQENEYVALAGFVGEDLVYGRGTRESVGVYADGSMAIPYETVYVMDTEGEILRTYEGGEECILAVSTYSNYISLSLGKKNGEVYQGIREEKLLSSQKDTAGAYGEIVESKSDQNLVESVLSFSVPVKEALQVRSELPVIASQADFVLNLELDDTWTDGYYAFARGRSLGVSDTMAEAIEQVFDYAGVVTEANRSVCWNRDARELYVNLGINERKAEDPEHTLGVCTQIFLENKGLYYSDLEEQLGEIGPKEFLQQVLEEEMIDLEGCQVSWLLYYINAGSPVLALTGEDSAVLLVGYDTSHVVIYDGVQDKYTMTIEEAQTYFAESGNRFISYS